MKDSRLIKLFDDHCKLSKMRMQTKSMHDVQDILKAFSRRINTIEALILVAVGKQQRHILKKLWKLDCVVRSFKEGRVKSEAGKTSLTTESINGVFFRTYTNDYTSDTMDDLILKFDDFIKYMDRIKSEESFLK